MALTLVVADFKREYDSWLRDQKDPSQYRFISSTKANQGFWRSYVFGDFKSIGRANRFLPATASAMRVACTERV
jgi:hypothetical protein